VLSFTTISNSFPTAQAAAEVNCISLAPAGIPEGGAAIRLGAVSWIAKINVNRNATGVPFTIERAAFGDGWKIMETVSFSPAFVVASHRHDFERVTSRKGKGE
jgi:hypothetical protein